MSITTRADEIRDEFAFLTDWEERYGHLIDLGKALAPLADAERTEANRVRGCASQVWFVSDAASDNRLHLRAESDAMIVSGLIALLLRLYDGAERAEALDFDARGFFEEIGVKEALSSQRANGLASMLARIEAIAGGELPSAQAGSMGSDSA